MKLRIIINHKIIKLLFLLLFLFLLFVKLFYPLYLFLFNFTLNCTEEICIAKKNILALNDVTCFNFENLIQS